MTEVEYLPLPIKSKSDPREYKTIKLKNDIVCILISDKDCDKGAAALDVNVGSLEDPFERAGLAHFLEHMLFMGSEKYPDQTEYSAYLSKNSGYCNAFTTQTDTNYMFECSNAALYGALDRFAQMFITPLFTEICAVHSEHEKNIMQDYWRERMIYLASGKPGNPYTKFSTGNLETLTHPTIRADLIEFHKKYYSSNLMKLVVYGNQDLETLEKWCVEIFSAVPNYQKPVLEYKEMPFDNTNYPGLWKIAPIKDEDHLIFVWTLDNFDPVYKSNPSKYYSHIFGFEGRDSLLSLLIDEGLALTLWAGGRTEMKLFTKFTINIKLTKKGLENYKDVVAYVFKYLQLVKKAGPSKELFEDLKNTKHLKFDYQDKQRPLDMAVDLALNLQQYAIEDAIRVEHLFEEYQPELLQKTIDSFGLENLRIVLKSKSLEKECDQVNKWYQAKYKSEPFPKEIVELYENPAIEPKFSKKKLGLPPKNPFIPQNFELLAKDVKDLPEYPTKIRSSEFSEVYFKQDNHFKLPKTDIKVKLYTNDGYLGSTLEGQVLAELWNLLFKEEIRELNYEADEAGSSVYTSIDKTGVMLTFSGFSDKIAELVENIFAKLIEFRTSLQEHTFNNIYQSYSMDLKNATKDVPFWQARRILAKMFMKGGDNYLESQKLAYLQKVSYKDFLQFQKQWLSNVFTEWLIIGNLVEDQALKIVTRAEDNIKKFNEDVKPLPKWKIPDVRALNIPTGPHWIYTSSIPPDESGQKESNSVSAIFFQHNPLKLKEKVLLMVLENYLEDPCFDQLRTIEQLGYIVSSRRYEFRGVGGFVIGVQSAVQPPHYLSGRIYKFLEKMRGDIAKITDEEFKTFQESVTVQLKEKDYSQGDELYRYWEEIDRHSFLFNRKELEIAEVQKLNKQELIDLFETIFYKEKKTGELQLVSEPHREENSKQTPERTKEEKELTFVENIETLHKKLPLYPDFYAAV